MNYFFYFLMSFFFTLGISAQNISNPSPIETPIQVQEQPLKTTISREANPTPYNPDELSKDDPGVSRFFNELINMFLVLGMIIAIMLAVAWALKKMLNTRVLQMNTTSSIKIIERRTLTPKAAIYLLDVCGKGFVIAESPLGVTNIGEVRLDEKDFEEEESKERPIFGKILQDKMKQDTNP